MSATAATVTGAGFTGSGVAAGSAAAAIQSGIGNVAAFGCHWCNWHIRHCGRSGCGGRTWLPGISLHFCDEFQALKTCLIGRFIILISYSFIIASESNR